MRTWFRVAGVLAGLAAGAFVACGFSPALIDGRTPDTPALPDAGPCEQASVQCADENTLRTCIGSGAVATDTTCEWGCIGPNSHCGELVPGGGGVQPSDLDDNAQLQDVVLNGAVDGNGGISGTTTRMTGHQNEILNGIGFFMRGNVAVYKARSFTISGSGITVGGSNPVAFVATDHITVDGLIDVTGGCSSTDAGPGGFPGARANDNAGGSGGGKGGGDDTFLGGGGGGNGGSGGDGGAGPSSAKAAGGSAFGDPQISVLVGGGGGGGGGHGGAPHGGGGGGALQLVAPKTIEITANGVIAAGGCGGDQSTESGGGGGAGGTVLVEAHDITCAGIIAVNGGGGGGGGGGVDGSDATNDRALTPGGPSANGSGGSGAGGAVITGLPGVVGAQHSGGGGGGAGRVRFHTRTGTATLDVSKLSPSPLDSPTTCTVGSAAVQ